MDIHSIASPVIFFVNSTPATTSRNIADYFHKPHNNIVKKIKALEADCDSEWSRQHFIPITRINTKTNQPYCFYIISRDGFLLLALRLRDTKIYAAKMAYLRFFDQAASMIDAIKYLNPRQQQHVYTALHDLAKINKVPQTENHACLDKRFANKRDARIHDYDEICTFFSIPPIDTLATSEAMQAFNTRYFYPKITARPRINAYPNQNWLTAKELLDSRYPSPLSHLLKTLAQDGHNVDGCALE